MKGGTIVDGSADQGIQVQRNKSDEEFDAELASDMAKRTSKLGNTEVAMALQVKEAREFISWSVSHMRKTWIDWMEESNSALNDLRQTRMAMERETKMVIASGKDLKTLYSEPSYIESHKRLSEMIDLLERMTVLKQNGSLDALADFILKIQCVR